MKIRRTVIHEDGVENSTVIYVENHLEPGDQVRVGFEKGTLEKATFELSFGVKIIYEKIDENETTAAKANTVGLSDAQVSLLKNP